MNIPGRVGGAREDQGMQHPGGGWGGCVWGGVSMHREEPSLKAFIRCLFRATLQQDLTVLVQQDADVFKHSFRESDQHVKQTTSKLLWLEP